MASAYSQEQIARFLSYIKLPSRYQELDKIPRDLQFLTVLTTHTLSTVPYENLSLHYSSDHKIDLNPHVLYKKIVGGARGRGGYCMENSILFNHILRGLGFDVYTAGVRIRPRVDGMPQGDYMGWVHVVNIVTFESGEKYMVDAAFGGDGATKPLRLVHNEPIPNIGTQEIRLMHDWIPSQTQRTEKTKNWIYQYRNGPEKEWNAFYAFPEFEFSEADFNVMNCFTGSSPESFQTFTVLIVKFLRRPVLENGTGEQNFDVEEIFGKRMLVNGMVKENLGGRTRVVKECVSEAERIEALKEYFDIELNEEEIDGIKGWVTEIRCPN